MLRQLEDHRFVAVVGSSGSGNSSLVRAGLLPAVREGFLLGTTDWLVLLMRPGQYPSTKAWLARVGRGLRAPMERRPSLQGQKRARRREAPGPSRHSDPPIVACSWPWPTRASGRMARSWSWWTSSRCSSPSCIRKTNAPRRDGSRHTESRSPGVSRPSPRPDHRRGTPRHSPCRIAPDLTIFGRGVTGGSCAQPQTSRTPAFCGWPSWGPARRDRPWLRSWPAAGRGDAFRARAASRVAGRRVPGPRRDTDAAAPGHRGTDRDHWARETRRLLRLVPHRPLQLHLRTLRPGRAPLRLQRSTATIRRGPARQRNRLGGADRTQPRPRGAGLSRVQNRARAHRGDPGRGIPLARPAARSHRGRHGTQPAGGPHSGYRHADRSTK